MTEKLGGPGLIRARVFGHTQFVEKDDLFAVEFMFIVGITSSIFKNFVIDPTKHVSPAVIVILCPAIKGMVMTFRTLKSDSEK